MVKINWKLILRGLTGGAITAVGGTFLVPIANQLFVFIPQAKLLIQGLTPHVLVAFGTAYVIADMVNQRFFKM